MEIVKVTYTTVLSYAYQNQQNIKAVMADLKKLNYAGINYHCCLCSDGKTFIHTAFFKSQEDKKLLNELPSFKYFQVQLKASGPEAAPSQELLTLVDSSVGIFQ